MTSKPTTAQLILKITNFILRLLLNTFFYVIVIILITIITIIVIVYINKKRGDLKW